MVTVVAHTLGVVFQTSVGTPKYLASEVLRSLYFSGVPQSFAKLSFGYLNFHIFDIFRLDSLFFINYLIFIQAKIKSYGDFFIIFIFFNVGFKILRLEEF